METSLLNLDIYPIIFSYCDWFTLIKLKYVNSFLYNESKRELKKRIASSKYPLGEPEARISVITEDINLESITVLLNGERMIVPKEQYKIPLIQVVIRQWFFYSLKNHSLILSGKLFKSIIRIMNRRIHENNHIPIDENRQELVFRFSDKGATLEDVF